MASEKPAELLALQPLLKEFDKETIIQRCAANELSYDEFYWRFMKTNWPVIITDVSNTWECRKWAQDEAQRAQDEAKPAQDEAQAAQDNENANISSSTTDNALIHINFDYLKSRIGNLDVPVADCNDTYFNSHTKLELKFHDFLERWKRIIVNTSEEAKLEPNCNVAKDNLYLKDWHLAAEMPKYKFYDVPKFFASDWLNEKLIAKKQDDYRFVYMGPKDSWTPFHSDVFGSFSWSTNIVGHKKWLIMPPDEEIKLNNSLNTLPISIDEEQLKTHKVRYFVINQMANEAVFVPSGWYHQVLNVTDTISVNHNWFNACNAMLVWRNLQLNLKNVYTEISDCRQMDNFETHCQTMLRASFGINYLDFIELLEIITARRLAALEDQTTTKKKKSLLLFDKYQMDKNHVLYDLESVRQVAIEMSIDMSVHVCPGQLYERCVRLIGQVQEFYKK